MALFSGDCGDLTPIACNEDVTGVPAGNYYSGLDVVTTEGTVYYLMVDGFSLSGNVSIGEYCLNITQLTNANPTVVPVTFQVDMTWEKEQGRTVDLSTVKIAGNFAANGVDITDWLPPASPTFTSIGNDIYEVTIEFPTSSVGNTLKYKFLNTPNTWGVCGDDQECFIGPCTGAGSEDRELVIPDAPTSFCYTFNTCEACNLPNSTRDLVQLPMTIAPNPFSNQALVTFHTPLNEAEARLTTMTGQLVRTYKVSGSNLVIAKNALTPGMYFFTVVTENGTSAAQKLIIE